MPFPSEIIVVPVMFGLPTAAVMMRMWLRHRERMAGLPGQQAAGAELEARIARIEQAVEAIGVEVERVGEGQRFVTRLLAERSERAERGPAGVSGG